MAVSKKTGKPDNSPAAVKAAQAGHEHYKWFDIFEADPVKKAFYDPITNSTKAVSVAFVLGKKLKPVFIEPALAMGQGGKDPGFNHFGIDADKNSGGGPAQIYLPKDKFRSGKEITWPDMARILQLHVSYPNTVLYKRYQELTNAGDGGFEKPYDYDAIEGEVGQQAEPAE